MGAGKGLGRKVLEYRDLCSRIGNNVLAKTESLNLIKFVQDFIKVFRW
jgi:hypothetical protein